MCRFFVYKKFAFKKINDIQIYDIIVGNVDVIK